jgi:hypothetical protein
MCLPFPRLELLELPDADLLELLVLAFLECLFFPCAVTPCARRRFCEAAALLLLLLLLLPSPGSHSESLMFIFKKNIRPKRQFFSKSKNREKMGVIVYSHIYTMTDSNYNPFIQSPCRT